MTLLICLSSFCLLSCIFLLLEVDVVHFLKQPVVFTTFGRINGRFPIHSKVVSHKTIGRLQDIFFNQHFQVVVQCTFLLFIGTWDIPFCFSFQHPGRVVFLLLKVTHLCGCGPVWIPQHGGRHRFSISHFTILWLGARRRREA